jgi:TonB family protein
VKPNYPDSLTIQQYLEGKLDPDVAHQLERQALDDPFLGDALEGYSAYKDPAADLSILQRQLHERIVHMQENKKVFDLSWQRLSVAAAAAVMFVSAGILFWMNSQRRPEQLASQSQQPVEVNVIDRDSVEAVIRSGDQSVAASSKNQETGTGKPSVSAYKPSDPITKKAVISPEAQEAIEANQMKPSDIQAESIASASASPAARQANLAKSGWPPYREYLEHNTRKFKSDPVLTGSVLLSLKIDASGKVTGVRVVQGLNEAYDREAIRIVKNGPEWPSTATGRSQEVQLEVNFGQ